VLDFITSARPEVVLLYGTTPQREVAMAAGVLSRRVPFVYASDVNVVELSESRKKLWRRLLVYKTLFSRVDAALTLGLTNETALGLLGARRLLPVPCYAADYARLREAGQRAVGGWPEGDGRTTALFVGRLSAAKNLTVVLGALAADDELRRSLCLVAAGDGPERAHLERITRSRDLDVRFLGPIPRRDIGGCLARADVLVLPSVVEPWGIVVTEALGLGIPVVASPGVGAAISLAGATQAVVLTAGHTVEDFRVGLRAFLRRREAPRMAARGTAESVREHYDRERVAAALVRELSALRASARS
jgi:glycosyltransferase involved in cell wall biosynthesis